MPAIRLLLLVAVWSVIPMCAPAVEPLSLDLFARNALVGWDHAGTATGWTMEDQTLSGTAECDPLLGGWTLGQGELAFDWVAADGGTVAITLLPMDASPAVTIQLTRDAACGQIMQGDEIVATGKLPSASEGGNQCIVRRWKNQLTVEVNHQLTSQCELPEDVRYGLQLSIPRGAGSFTRLQLDEPLGAPIFDGKQLTGWHTPGNREAWDVRHGEIWGLGRRGQYLQTDDAWQNYTLALEYKLQRRGNSGVGIRTPRGGWPSADGMELQFYDEPTGTPLHRGSTMSLYGNVVPLAHNADPDGWNRVIVQVHGHMISGWMNGQLVQHVNCRWSPELRHRNLHGWIGLQDHGDQVRFRNVTVQRLPDGPGHFAWYRTPPMEFAHRALDSVMNTVRAATPDAATTEYHELRSSSTEQPVSLQLTGPAALARLAWPAATSLDTRVRLFVDDAGDEQGAPLFAGTLAELRAQLPGIAGESPQWLGYLGFASSLRLEVAAGPSEPWLIEVIRPAEAEQTVASTTNTQQASVLHRELLPAIDYRISQFGNGRHRDFAPYPTVATDPASLAPGERRTVAQCDGAGVAVWWKIIAPAESLVNDDLRVLITVDGESTPAVDAPLHLLFAGLVSDTKWPNPVLLYDEGFTSYLALPFANGITIDVLNAGTEPSAALGGAMSIAPSETLTTAAIEGNRRLRGHHVQTSESGPTGVQLTGAGRIVGVIFSAEGEQLPGTLHVTCDSVDQQLPLATWFGLTPAASERFPLAGRHEQLVWRYPLVAPPTFAERFAISVPELGNGEILVLSYSTTDGEHTTEQ